MKINIHNQFKIVLIVTFLISTVSTHSFGKAAAQVIQPVLVEFDSDEGMLRLERSKAKVDFFSLANHFESQSNGLFCGPTTAAIILNVMTMHAPDAKLPQDTTSVTDDDRKFLQKDVNPLLSRHTQKTVIESSGKPREQIFGKLIDVGDKKNVSDMGFQLKQFATMMQKNGAKAEAYSVTDQSSREEIIAAFEKNLKTRGDYIVVNYKRAEVGQKGGGHISPIGAYDKKSNSFLVMDVNPTKAKWVWMPADTLIKGMNTFDSLENRGYVIISKN